MVTGLNIIGSNKALQDHYARRIVAFIIDAVVVFIFSLIIMFFLVPSLWFTTGFGGLVWGFGLLVTAVIGLMYWIIPEGLWGASLGKKLMGLQVVGTTGPVDIAKAAVRNISKFHWLILLLDWIVGLGTEGDPRQKATDRFAGTTVVRTDQHAYMEEQFRQMATPPPHPHVPTGYAQPTPAWPGQQAPPPGYQPSAPQAAPAPPAQQAAQPWQAWPGQQSGQQPPPQSGWPQHRWNEQGQLVQPARFCSNCGGALVPRGDGHMVCSRCGAVY